MAHRRLNKRPRVTTDDKCVDLLMQIHNIPRDKAWAKHRMIQELKQLQS